MPGSARWIGLAATFCGAFALTGTGVLGAVEAAGLPYRDVDVGAGLALTQQLEAVSKTPRGLRVVYLGDSLVMRRAEGDDTPPRRLRRLLRSQGRLGPVQLRPVALAGLGAFSHYFFSDAVAEVDPDLVVLSVNLRWFSGFWNRVVERGALVGWLPARRWPEAATLPLHAVGVSADMVLLERALVVSGAMPAWHRLRREQVRLGGGLARAEDWVQGWAGGPVAYRRAHSAADAALLARGNRSSLHQVQQTLGEVLDGVGPEHPSLRALDAALGGLRARGAACLVYVAPLNVEHLERLGVSDVAGLERSIASIEAVARRHGAAFLDLHALLPDADFSDFADHLVLDPQSEGATRLARALLPAARAALLESQRGPG